MDMINHGNSILEWFTNRSMGNHVKVELPSDWCYDKFRGFGTCVVFKRKKPCRFIGHYSIENFDGASLGDYFPDYRFEGKPVRIDESYMIWLHYTQNTRKWKEAKNFVTFCFEEDNEDIQVKDFGVRLIYDGDLQQDVTNLNMLQDLPTLSQHGGALCLYGLHGDVIQWSRAGCKASASSEGLAECKASASNIRRIQVKDVVKEVEDYMKTYSSAGMNISWYVEGIR
ncbi:hypothetical protein Tco_0605307 [Tanacetum coccineum]